MGVTMKSYAQYANASLTVTNSAELNAAINQLSGGSGGTINVDPNGGPYDLHVSNIGSANSPVLIQSAGGGDPVFHSVTIQKSEYLAFDGLDFDTSHMTGRQFWEDDLRIENSNNIEFHNSSFTGHAQGYLSEGSATEAPTGVKGHSAAYVFDSQDITFSGNTFTNHFNTFRAEDIQGFVFDDNEITGFQGDGFHAGGLQNAQITNNHLHTPLGSTQTITHSDFIHIRAYQADLVNDGIEISGNLIDSSSGWGAQGIHISNTRFGSGTQWDGYLKNISIHDNVIHTSLPRGIGVNNVEGLEVYNNTVLWNSASQIETTPDSTPISWDARILIYTSPGAQIYDNVASIIRYDGTIDPSGGYMIDYNDPNASNYVGKHFVNVDGSGNPNSYDLNLLPGSSLYGNTGAAMSSGGTASATGVLGTSGSAAAAPVVAPVTTNNVPDQTSNSNSNSNSGDTSGGDTGGATVAAPTTTSSSGDASSGGDTSADGDTGGAAVATPTTTSAPEGASSGDDTGSGDDASSGGDTGSGDDAGDAPALAPVSAFAFAPVPVATSLDDTGSGDDQGSGSDSGSSDAVTPIQISGFEDAPTVINADVSVPATPVQLVVAGGDTGSDDADTSASQDTGSSDDGASTGATAGVQAAALDAGSDVAGASGSQDDTSGDDASAAPDTVTEAPAPAAYDADTNIPKGLAKKMAKDPLDDDDEDGNIIAKFFQMLFGGGDDDDGASTGPSPKAYGKAKGLDEIVPVTEWIDDSDTSSARSDEDDDDDDASLAA